MNRWNEMTRREGVQLTGARRPTPDVGGGSHPPRRAEHDRTARPSTRVRRSAYPQSLHVGERTTHGPLHGRSSLAVWRPLAPGFLLACPAFHHTAH
jgi:hypothetical protein